MALINCPECNAEVSDRAGACVKCGCPLAHVKCPECNTAVFDNADACGKCGCPLKEPVYVSTAIHSITPVFDKIEEFEPLEKKSKMVSAFDDELDELEKKSSMGGMLKGLLVIVVFIGLSVFLIQLFCGDSDSGSTSSKSSSGSSNVRREKGWFSPDQFQECLRNASKISTQQLHTAYDANKVKFQMDMENTPFIITGQISEIRRGYITDEYIVELDIPNAIISTVGVVYPENIPQVDQEYIRSLQKKHTFQALVVGTSTSSYVHVAHTTINGKIHIQRFATTRPPTAKEQLKEQFGEAAKSLKELFGQ